MSASKTLVAALLVLAAWIAAPRSALAITRCDVLNDAKSWVDNHVPYSWGPGAAHCPGPYYCDPLRNNTCYRSDCSGFVSATWGLASPGHTSYSFAGGPWDDGLSYVIPADQLQPGDALNFPGDPNGGTGHVMLYVSGAAIPGNEIVVYEEYSCGHFAELRTRKYDPKYVPIRYVNIEPCYSDKSPSQLTGNATLSLVNWTNTGTWPSEGHPELFALQTGGNLVHLYATGNQDDWSAPASLGKGVGCGAASAYWPYPKSYPEVFASSSGGALQHLWLASEGWKSFEDFGAKNYTQLSTLSWTNGNVEVFALGPDHALWHRYWDTGANNWSAWVSMQGNFATGASPILWGDGHAELFATDNKGVPWHNWSGDFPTGWHGWEKLEGSLSSRPVPVRWSDGHLDLFARGTDGQLYRTAYLSDGWHPFTVESAGVKFEGEPSVAMNPEGAGTPEGPEVVVRGTDGKVLHLWYDGKGYRPFEPLQDKTVASDPFAWLRDDGTLQVFAVTAAGELTSLRRNADKVWGKWTVLGKGFESCAEAPSQPKADAGTQAEAGKEPEEKDAALGSEAKPKTDAGSTPVVSEDRDAQVRADAPSTLTHSTPGDTQAEGCSCRFAGRGGHSAWAMTLGLGLLGFGIVSRRRARARAATAFGRRICKQLRLSAIALCVACASCALPVSEGEPIGSLSQANTKQCPGQTVEGVDVYDGDGAIDWAAVKASGREFAFIKATQGTYNVNTRFPYNWQQTKAAGVLRSAYHFFDPTEDGVAQAKAFLQVLGTLEPGDLAPMLDMECVDGSASCLGSYHGGAVPPEVLMQRTLDWLNTVESATGRKPIIYSYPAYFPGLGVDTSALAAYPLFIATLGDCASVPSPWTSAAFWQYSWYGTVPGIPSNGGVDLDRFFGSIEELKALTNGGGRSLSQISGNDSIALVNWTNTGTWPLDGHPEAFVRRASGQLDHLYATGTTDSWSAPAALDDGGECGFSASYWPAPKSYPELFSPSGAGAATHLWFNSSEWNQLQDFGGKGLSHLSTLSWSDGRQEVFALGPDQALWHKYWDNSIANWAEWQSLGGKLASGASAILWGDGHAELFAIDASGNPWHNWSGSFANGWHGWEKLEGSLSSRPIPVRWPDGHLDVFATGKDGQLYRTAYLNNQWHPFTVESAGVLIEGEPSVAMNPEGAGTPAGPEVVVRSQQGKVLHLWWNGSTYAKLEPLGDQSSASNPFAWLREDSTLEVFAIDPKGNLRHTRRAQDKTWSKWTTLGSGYDPCSESETNPPAATDAGAPPSTGKDAGTPGKDAQAPKDAAGERTAEGGLAPAPTAEAGTHFSLGQGYATGDGGSCSTTSTPAAPGGALLLSLLIAFSTRRRRGEGHAHR